MNISTLLKQFGKGYLQATFMTWRLTFLSFILGLLLGVLLTILRLSPIKPLRKVSELYVQIFRNIPGAALLIFLVYALPYLDIVWAYFTCVLTATFMIVAAFCSEYLMTGVNTISVGQIEAARSLGMRFFQIIRRIVIPQAFRSAVLPMTNLCVATMLTTALASQVPLKPTDLTGMVSYINTHAAGGVTAFVISAAIYLGTALVIGFIGNQIDKRVRILR